MAVNELKKLLMSRILNSEHGTVRNAEFRTKVDLNYRNQDNGKIVFAGFRTTKQRKMGQKI